MHTTNANRYDTIVIGGGQAGLAAGYQLRNAGRSFLILDANKHPGDTWRNRWDSLRLFSPAQYDGLPGLRFPAPSGIFPTKDEMADYLERYVGHFELPILHEMRVTKVTQVENGMNLECSERQFFCKNVIVAAGAYASPRLPEFVGALNPSIMQLHSSEYRRATYLPPGRILVVGFGTSGVEIACDLATAGRKVLISGRPTSQVLSKFVPKIFSSRNPLLRLLGKAHWNFMHRVVTINTPMGRKAKAQMAHRGQPLIRLNQQHILDLGVDHIPRVSGVVDGKPRLDDGRILDVSAVIWCTGFRSDYLFLDFPALRFDEKGRPIAPYGIVSEIPGLYFLGVPFQVGLTSSLVGGVGRDAAVVVRHIVEEEARAPRPSSGGYREPVYEPKF